MAARLQNKFQAEGDALAMLAHPNIVQVYDLGVVGTDYYIAMEFVDGPDLNSLLHALRVRNGSVPMGGALEIAQVSPKAWKPLGLVLFQDPGWGT